MAVEELEDSPSAVAILLGMPLPPLAILLRLARLPPVHGVEPGIVPRAAYAEPAGVAPPPRAACGCERPRSLRPAGPIGQVFCPLLTSLCLFFDIVFCSPRIFYCVVSGVIDRAAIITPLEERTIVTFLTFFAVKISRASFIALHPPQFHLYCPAIQGSRDRLHGHTVKIIVNHSAITVSNAAVRR